MKHLLTILVFILLPAIADAAVFSTPVKRPTRNQYDSSSATPEKRGFQQLKKEVKITMKSYTHKKTGISAQYPSDWKLVDSGGGFALNPVYDGISEKTRRNSRIDVHVGGVPNPNKKTYTLEDLDKYVMSQATLSDSIRLSDWYIPSFALLSSEDVQLFGKDGRKYVYTGERSSKKFKAALYLMVSDQKMYNVTFESDNASFDTDSLVFEKLLASLKLKPVKVETAPKRRTRK